MEVQYIHVSILSLTPLGLWVNNNNILLLLGQCLFVYVCTQPPPHLGGWRPAETAQCLKSNQIFRDITRNVEEKGNTTRNIQRSISFSPLRYVFYLGKSITFGTVQDTTDSLKEYCTVYSKSLLLRLLNLPRQCLLYSL